LAQWGIGQGFCLAVGPLYSSIDCSGVGRRWNRNGVLRRRAQGGAYFPSARGAVLIQVKVRRLRLDDLVPHCSWRTPHAKSIRRSFAIAIALLALGVMPAEAGTAPAASSGVRRSASTIDEGRGPGVRTGPTPLCRQVGELIGDKVAIWDRQGNWYEVACMSGHCTWRNERPRPHGWAYRLHPRRGGALRVAHRAAYGPTNPAVAGRQRLSTALQQALSAPYDWKVPADHRLFISVRRVSLTF
jgi:hypothetical protein